MTTNIYILKLSDGKWYIGKTDDVKKRYQQHMNGNGSSWTKRYTPISLEKTIANASPFEEDKVTKEYMAKYGIENVRGGSYCNLDLNDYQLEALNREIWGAQNKCARCGRSSHFEKNCYAKTDVDGNEFVSDDESDEREYTSPSFYNPLYGSVVINKSIQKKGAIQAPSKPKESCVERRGAIQAPSKVRTCRRCGHEGHWISECYANTDSNGNYIR